MPRNSGICIGGPLAGQLYSSDADSFTVQDEPSFSTADYVSENPAASVMQFRNCVYRFMQGFGVREKRFDFWTIGPMDPVDALNAMAVGYLESCERDRDRI